MKLDETNREIYNFYSSLKKNVIFAMQKITSA